MRGRPFSALFFVLFALLALPCSNLAQEPEARNQVVIILDGSGSYKPRQSEAIDKVSELLSGMSQTKVHRWETATDGIVIISMDAVPETLWKGTLRDLKTLDRGFWKRRFESRTDYEGCTDVQGAFLLAMRFLKGDPRKVKKYLFVFSDLIHQPPRDSVRHCAAIERQPPKDFPWKELQDVSVSGFWLPPDQKLLWKGAAEGRGLGASFVFYSSSESATIKVLPPPRPVIELTEAEQEARRQRVFSGARAFLKLLAVLGGFLLLGPFAVYAAVRIVNRRRRTA